MARLETLRSTQSQARLCASGGRPEGGETGRHQGSELQEAGDRDQRDRDSSLGRHGLVFVLAAVGHGVE